MSGRPTLMKIPQKITFYSQNRIYEGAYSTSKPAVYVGIGACLAIAGLFSWWSISAVRSKRPLPGTFSDEWKKNEAEKSKTRRADPLHNHSSGQKV